MNPLATSYLVNLIKRANETGEDIDWLAKGMISVFCLSALGLFLLFLNRRQIPLVLKQMRQRTLSSSLTILSVALGVGLAVGVLLLQRECEKLFSQTDYGYDLIVGPKGSELQLVLNTVYQLDKSQGMIPYSLYEDLSRDKHPQIRNAIPYVVGDQWKGHRIIATTPQIFPVDHENKPFPADKVFQYRKDMTYQIASGRAFHPLKFEAVAGASAGLKIGDQFKPSHGVGGVSPDEHDELWTVVGLLAPTRTAIDNVIYIPIVSTYAIPDHEKGLEEMAAFQAAASGETAASTKPAHQSEDLLKDAASPHHDHEEAYELNPDGTIMLELPKEQWRVSAIILKTRGPAQTGVIQWQMQTAGGAMAINPATVMSGFFSEFFGDTTRVLLLIALLVSVVAGISILVSIYNSVVARKKEITIIRALGASKLRVLSLLCIEAGFIGFLGSVLGLALGHLACFGGSLFLKSKINQDFNWLAPSEAEWIYVALMVLLAILAGLLPALVAYRTPVAKNLSA